MSDDPFRRPGSSGSSDRWGGGGNSYSDDPRYRTGAAVQDTIDRANESARGKDVSSDVSTDPLQDKLQAARDRTESALKSASDSAREKADPLLDSARQSFDQARAKADEYAKNFGEGSQTFEMYEQLRKKLDAVGAKNWKFEKDPTSGETTFRCELPHRDNPTLFRVFEAKSKEELKAMLAVADQVERWVAGGR